MNKLGLRYICDVCDKAFDSKHALLGDCKVHKIPHIKTSFRFVKDTYVKFKAICHSNGVTTCHVIWTCIRAIVAADDLITNNLFTSNSIIINITQSFMGKPKSPYKTLISEEKIIIPSSTIRSNIVCNICEITENDVDDCGYVIHKDGCSEKLLAEQLRFAVLKELGME